MSSSVAGHADPGSLNLTVRTPKMLHFDDRNINQIHEYVPNGTNLKEYILQHFTSPTPEHRTQCIQIGKALARWFRSFCAWTSHPNQTELKTMVAEHTQAQDVKYMITVQFMHERIKQFPGILDELKDVVGDIEKMLLAERESEKGYQVIHGDFWTGK
jgi:hypothetical protein